MKEHCTYTIADYIHDVGRKTRVKSRNDNLKQERGTDQATRRVPDGHGAIPFQVLNYLNYGEGYWEKQQIVQIRAHELGGLTCSLQSLVTHEH